MGTPTELEATARRAIDVAKAFADEPGSNGSKPPSKRPTVPAPRPTEEDHGEVVAMLPLDAVPVLAMADDDVPWGELGELASRLVHRVDGKATTMAIVMGAQATPTDGALELGRLVRRGVLRVAPPAPPPSTADDGPEIEVKQVSIIRGRVLK